MMQIHLNYLLNNDKIKYLLNNGFIKKVKSLKYPNKTFMRGNKDKK